MARREYDQLCALAHALDILGERWTLLIVRNLLVGPQRFKDLLDGLPGIGPHLLAARLKHLERHDVVRRKRLPPPAGSAVYELTNIGKELEPVLLILFRFGMRSLRKPRPGETIGQPSALLGFRATFRGEMAAGVRETYEYRVGQQVFQVRVENGSMEVASEPAVNPDVVISSDTETFVAVGSGQLSPIEAMSSGRFKMEGDGAAIAHAAQIFQPPPAGRPSSG